MSGGRCACKRNSYNPRKMLDWGLSASASGGFAPAAPGCVHHAYGVSRCSASIAACREDDICSIRIYSCVCCSKECR